MMGFFGYHLNVGLNVMHDYIEEVASQYEYRTCRNTDFDGKVVLNN